MALEAARKSKGFTQKHMANVLGIAVSTYNQYETGARGIPNNIANNVAKILNVKVNELFSPTKFMINKF